MDPDKGIAGVDNPLGPSATWRRTLCESRNYGDYFSTKPVAFNEFPQWREYTVPLATSTAGVSSIQLRQPVAQNQSNKRNSPSSTRRRHLRDIHIRNRVSPEMRWALEEKAIHSDEEQADPHEEKQRLVRNRLRKLRRKKRRMRWNKQKNTLVRLAQEQYLGTIKTSVSMPQLREHNSKNDKEEQSLKAMWESFDGDMPIQTTSPVAKIRRQARWQQQAKLKKSPIRISGRQKRGRKKRYAAPLRRNPRRHKDIVDEEEAIIVKRQRLKETYAAYKAMTNAVVQAHGRLALNASSKESGKKRRKKKEKTQKGQDQDLKQLYGRNKNPGSLQPMSPELLADLEKHQQRLQLEMKTLTKQVNEMQMRKDDADSGLESGDVYGKMTLYK